MILSGNTEDGSIFRDFNGFVKDKKHGRWPRICSSSGDNNGLKNFRALRKATERGGSTELVRGGA